MWRKGLESLNLVACRLERFYSGLSIKKLKDEPFKIGRSLPSTAFQNGSGRYNAGLLPLLYLCKIKRLNPD